MSGLRVVLLLTFCFTPLGVFSADKATDKLRADYLSALKTFKKLQDAYWNEKENPLLTETLKNLIEDPLVTTDAKGTAGISLEEISTLAKTIDVLYEKDELSETIGKALTDPKRSENEKRLLNRVRLFIDISKKKAAILPEDAKKEDKAFENGVLAYLGEVKKSEKEEAKREKLTELDKKNPGAYDFHSIDGPVPKKRPAAEFQEAYKKWKALNSEVAYTDLLKWLEAINNVDPKKDTSYNAAHLLLNHFDKHMNTILNDKNYADYGLNKNGRNFLGALKVMRDEKDYKRLQGLSKASNPILREGASRELLRRFNSKNKVRLWSQNDFPHSELTDLAQSEKALLGTSEPEAAKAFVKHLNLLNKTKLNAIRSKWDGRKAVTDPMAKLYATRTHCSALVIQKIRENKRKLNATELKTLSECQEQAGFVNAVNDLYGAQQTRNKNFHAWMRNGDKDKVLGAYKPEELMAYRDQRMATALDESLPPEVRARAKDEYVKLKKWLDGDKLLKVKTGPKDEDFVYAQVVQSKDPGLNREFNDKDGTVKTKETSDRLKNTPVQVWFLGKTDDEVFASDARFYQRGKPGDAFHAQTATRAFNNSDFPRSRYQGFDVLQPTKDFWAGLEASKKRGLPVNLLYSPKHDGLNKRSSLKRAVPDWSRKLIKLSESISPKIHGGLDWSKYLAKLPPPSPKKELSPAQQVLALSQSKKCTQCHGVKSMDSIRRLGLDREMEGKGKKGPTIRSQLTDANMIIAFKKWLEGK